MHFALISGFQVCSDAPKLFTRLATSLHTHTGTLTEQEAAAAAAAEYTIPDLSTLLLFLAPLTWSHTLRDQQFGAISPSLRKFEDTFELRDSQHPVFK